MAGIRVGKTPLVNEINVMRMYELKNFMDI